MEFIRPNVLSPVIDKATHPPELQALLEEFTDVFRETLESLPPARSVQHQVQLQGSLPKARPLYRLTPKEDNALKQHLVEALDKGFIKPSLLPYGAAVFFVAKKDRTLRLVTDYCALNDVTVKNKYPLPLIDNLFDTLADSRVFSKIDLIAGYNQVRITPGNESKTAFCTRYGSYKCRVMNFGMTNAPSTFTMLMNEAFAHLVGKCVVVYLDNIIVFSKTQKDHLHHLRQVLETL